MAYRSRHRARHLDIRNESSGVAAARADAGIPERHCAPRRDAFGAQQPFGRVSCGESANEEPVGQAQECRKEAEAENQGKVAKSARGRCFIVLAVGVRQESRSSLQAAAGEARLGIRESILVDGRYRARTSDLLLVRQALSQLS